jgi:hypothetical protein
MVLFVTTTWYYESSRPVDVAWYGYQLRYELSTPFLQILQPRGCDLFMGVSPRRGLEIA